MMTDTPTMPFLVGLGPGPSTGRQLPLARHHLLVGQAPSCDIRLSEAQVGPQHAVLTRRDGRTWVQDLGTPGGTFVNGQRLSGIPHPLHRGDVIVFGTVALRLEAESAPADPLPDPVPAAVRTPDQLRRPDALRREIDLLRTRSRRLLGWGGAVFLLGFGLFAAGVLGLLTETGRDPSSQPLGPDVVGVPCAVLGWGISAMGMALLVAGLVLNAAAGARRRQADREIPWPTSAQRAR